MRLLICVFLLWFSLGSCRVVKRAHTEVKRSDSSRIEQTQQSGMQQGFIEKIVRDTVLKIQERVLHDTIDLNHLRTGESNTKLGNNQSTTVSNLGNGKIAIESRCHEMEVLLKGQMQQTSYWREKYDSSKLQKANSSQSSQVIDTKKTSKIPVLIVILGIAIIVVITGTFIVIKYVK